jgi:hypothetical protein
MFNIDDKQNYALIELNLYSFKSLFAIVLIEL